MFAFGGQSDGRLAIVRGGVQISGVSDKKLDDFEMTIGRGREQRRVTGTVMIIGVDAGSEQPLDNRRMSGCNGRRERVIAGPIGGGGVKIRSLPGKVARRVEMPKKAGQGKDGETVRRKGFRDR